MEQPKIEMREMHTILVFANGSPVGTIINETDEWVVMLTSEMPLNLRHFQTKDEAVNYITSRVVKGEGSE